MLLSLFSWEKRNFTYKEGAEGPDFIDAAGCTDQACWPSRSTQRRCFHPRRFNKFTFFSASHHQLLSVTETKTQESLAPLGSGGPPARISAWNWTRVRTGLAWGGGVSDWHWREETERLPGQTGYVKYNFKMSLSSVPVIPRSGSWDLRECFHLSKFFGGSQHPACTSPLFSSTQEALPDPPWCCVSLLLPWAPKALTDSYPT